MIDFNQEYTRENLVKKLPTNMGPKIWALTASDASVYFAATDFYLKTPIVMKKYYINVI